MSSISSVNSSPLASLFSSGLTGTPSSSDTANSGQAQNTWSAVNEVEQIPGQLKTQARNWAAQELSHLLDVLRVTLQADPSSGEALKQLAQGISSDTKQIGGKTDNNSAADSVTSLVAASQSANVTQIDISFSETITQTQIFTDSGVSNGNNNIYFTSQSETTDLEIAVSSVSGDIQTSPEEYAHDVALLSQASVAIGQINATLQKAIQEQNKNDPSKQAVDGASNNIQNALNGLISDAVNGLIASPSASLTAGIPGTLTQTA